MTCSKSVTGWNSQIYSKSGYVDNVFVTFKPFDRNGYRMMGLDSNPSESVDFTSIDFCFFCQGGGSLYIFESGTQITLPAGHTTYIGGDELRIEYSGGYVRYYHNGVLVRSVARAIGNPLYLDSSFYNSGSVYDVGFGVGQANSNRAISGTTNLTGITWVQRGNVVDVVISGYKASNTNVITITGLPTPTGNPYRIARLFKNDAIVGYVEYFNNWHVQVDKSGYLNTDLYATFTYLTDE